MTRSSPFALIATAFAAGLWLAAQATPSGQAALPLSVAWVCVLGLAAGLVGIFAWRRRPARAWCAACVSLLAVGALWQFEHTPGLELERAFGSHAFPSPAAYNGQFVVLEGDVDAEPDVRLTYTMLRLRVRRLHTTAGDRPVNGDVLMRADHTVMWRYGDVVRGFGLLDALPILSTFDYRAHEARMGVFTWMSRPDKVQRIGTGAGSPFTRAVLDVKAALRMAVQRSMPAPESALLNGILIGDDNELPADIQTAFQRTGTAHIVAISGFNVSIVVALIVPWLSRVFNRNRAAWVAIPAILLYTLLVGASASVQRASAMAILVMGGQLLWRRSITLNTLCAATFLLLLAEPPLLFDVGFQLSVAATLGLVLYVDRWQAPLQRLIEKQLKSEITQRAARTLADVTLTTTAATLTTTPILLANFYRFSLVALFTNALVLPLQSAAMISGMLTALGSVLPGAWMQWLALPSYALLTATLRIVQAMSALSWASAPWFDFGPAHAVVYYAVLGLLTAWASHRPSGDAIRNALTGFRQAIVTRRPPLPHLSVGWVALVLCIAAVLGGVYAFQRPDGKLHVTFAGTGAFIQTPQGRQVVFAGGGAVLPVLGRAMPLWDKGVELLVLPQRDEAARADTLPFLQRYQVGAVIQPALWMRPDADEPDERTALFTEWMSQTLVHDTTVLTPSIGTRVMIEPGVVITLEQRVNGGLGARLSYGRHTFELVGSRDPISGTLDGADVVFVRVQKGQAALLNAAAPRWVVWADAGGAGLPPRLNETIHTLPLRDAGTLEFVSDGERLDVR
jgi:competence protein ComEC